MKIFICLALFIAIAYGGLQGVKFHQTPVWPPYIYRFSSYIVSTDSTGNTTTSVTLVQDSLTLNFNAVGWDNTNKVVYVSYGSGYLAAVKQGNTEPTWSSGSSIFEGLGQLLVQQSTGTLFGGNSQGVFKINPITGAFSTVVDYRTLCGGSSDICSLSNFAFDQEQNLFYISYYNPNGDKNNKCGVWTADLNGKSVGKSQDFQSCEIGLGGSPWFDVLDGQVVAIWQRYTSQNHNAVVLIDPASANVTVVANIQNPGLLSGTFDGKDTVYATDGCVLYKVGISTGTVTQTSVVFSEGDTCEYTLNTLSEVYWNSD